MMADNTTALINMFKAAQTKANEANEARYQELLSTYGGSGQSMMSLVNQFGKTAQQRIAKSTQKQQTTTMNNLVSSGLAVPEVMGSMQKGLQSDATRQLQSAKESQTRQMAGGLAGKAAAIEARTDQGPDMGTFAQLLQLAAMNNQEGASAGAIALASGPWSSSYNLSRGWWDQANQQGNLAQLLTQRGY
jgi:hypothetical protein